MPDLDPRVMAGSRNVDSAGDEVTARECHRVWPVRRRVIDAVLVGIVIITAVAVWVAGLGFFSAGMALDRPRCLESQPTCDSAWSWTPPGTRYQWVVSEGAAMRSATEPWASHRTDSLAWTAIVVAIAGVAAVAVLRRGRSSAHRRRPPLRPRGRRLELP